jgi:RimJ/RimL family protein N-acetyltransferase
MKFNFIPIRNGLYLTEVKETDAIFFIKYLNDIEIFHNTLTIPYPYHKQDADNFIAFCRKQEATHGNVVSAWTIRNETGELVGGIGRFMHTGTQGHYDEIGYWLGAPFRKQGVMSTVVRGLCDFLFENTALRRIEAYIFEDNIASAQTLEKAGFEQEGILKNRILKNGILKNAILFAKIK